MLSASELTFRKHIYTTRCSQKHLQLSTPVLNSLKMRPWAIQKSTMAQFWFDFSDKEIVFYSVFFQIFRLQEQWVKVPEAARAAPWASCGR